MRPFNSITWNGESSLKYGVRILDRGIPRISPGERYERVSIDGRDGDLFIPLNSIPSVDFSLPINVLDSGRADEIVRWLRKKPKGDLILSWDDMYVYDAIYLDQHDIKTLLTKLGEAVLPFKLHPWKYQYQGLDAKTVTQILNPTIYDSEPVYTITGTGDLDFYVNDELIRFKNMSGPVTIDVGKGEVIGTDLSNVLTYPFPKLKPGLNTFSQEITVMPKWRERL